MVEITSPKDLETWLRGKPREWTQGIAARAALRVLPYAFQSDTLENWVERHGLTLFRAMVISWAGSYDTRHAAALASNALSRATAHANSYVNVAAAAIARAASHAAAYTSASSAAFAAQYAADAADEADYASYTIWENISVDCDELATASDPATVARPLMRERLWLRSSSYNWSKNWEDAAARLLTLDPSYQVWIDWYNRRITGEDAAFDIPGDTNRTEDKKILIKLADATDKYFWDKGAAHVNTTLQRWIDEARARVAAPKQTRAEVQQKLVQSASPEAQIVDGKLDAGPNSVFDKPQFSGNLADLPSEMRAFIGALSASLPPNASDTMRHCLAAYNDELLVRGNRPILNILKGMASAIAAEVWTAPGAADQDNPDAWVMKDPREWNAGAADLFRTFFKSHLDLITHFPLDPEREALIAATPIDEVAASDRALTDPVDAVTAMIIALAKEGLATDNIVRIVEAHQLYTRDIAGLPRPDAAGLPSTIITPKRRHVLMTAGFYLQAYEVLGITAALAASPQVQALMVQLAEAAQRLMAFIL